MLYIDFGLQTVILALESFHEQRVFEGDRGYSRNPGDQLKVILLESHSGPLSIHVNNPERLFKSDQRNRQ